MMHSLTVRHKAIIHSNVLGMSMRQVAKMRRYGVGDSVYC